MPLKFDASRLPDTSNEYVCWIDIMGIKSMMSRSLKISSNFMCKVHISVLLHQGNVKVYPVMDGFYASSPNQNDIIGFIKDVFRELVDEFCNQKKVYYRFLVRGALAFGPVIHGEQIPQEASYDLQANPEYKNSILLGLPMIQACQSERFAPPFGMYIHESARSFSPAGVEPIHHTWMRWFDEDKREGYLQKINEYFEWYKTRTNYLEYDKEKVQEHHEKAVEYFQPS